MPLPRLQLFEFNDARWAPSIVRDTLVDSLSRAIRWGGLLDGIVAPLRECLRRAETNAVLDLCAGAGGPAAVLSSALPDVDFLLSDLYPQVDAWKSAGLRFISEPIDATNIPPSLGEDRVRLLVNALHHFPPPLARDVLRGLCAGNSPGVFIAEGLVRNPLSFAAMGPVGLASLLSTPILAPKRRLLATALLPASLAASVWDGTVSALRIHTPSELYAMVAELPGWEWSWGEYQHSAGLGRGTWFRGTRR
ncbi:MAG: hypothetical protein DI536_17795 [Archangium gephyra]|uniref:Class I SAM-dependent methyltransferase n=1 Tax=Archangium gephyra TaxID=48 RepID=A0A2W5T7F5_9BACT|nr:MAG: hypothetical protein DI536_17795 [Archangium gephyra]